MACTICRTIPASASAPAEFIPCARHDEPLMARCAHCGEELEMYGEGTGVVYTFKDGETFYHDGCRSEMMAEFRRDEVREGVA